jgi:CheY-like chemotaxis protein
VDLLITDLIMPGMSGRELAEQALALSPGLKVLCTSGYVWGPDHVPSPKFLQKPFTTRELVDKVAALLAPAST